ncbi:integrin beta-like protein 1 isoform X1 [Ruditapes philippinarum]|uniref:integrin beta-like protein 1 isoform X1 n=1 Tax=Ruditapes philippinarum TaxID=129788 RepID=UPI00295AEC6D|nr:integrin beta-like protein 1 isoform X1 [Ruditapes philippinarum]
MRSIYKLGLLMILTFLVLNGRICNAGKVSAEDCTKVGTECSGITHAVCNKTSLKCQCDAGFKEDSTGGSTCIKKKVSEVVCTNGGSECSTITHSSCAATLKCKCGTGYGEDTTDGSTCVSSASSHNIQSKQRVSEVVCSNGGSECHVITHSSCDATLKCKCDTGYGEDTTDGSTCIQTTNNLNTNQQNKRRVSEVVCTDGGNECDTIVHSACDVPSLKCKCGTTYAEDSTDGSTCVMKVASIVCSENGSQCASIDHAECDLTATKCKCSDGFKMTADKCAPAGNTGVSASLAYTVLALPVILAIKVTMM